MAADQGRANMMQSAGDIASQFQMKHGEEQVYRCESHGEYRGKPFSLTGRSWLDPACPECESERQALEATQQERAKAEAEARRLVLAGIPERFRGATLDGYQATEQGQKRALAIIGRYLERFEERLKAGGGLMLIGRTGNGKTHLACALVRELVTQGRSALYCDIMGLMQRVKGTYRRGSEETEEQAIERFVRPDLLVIDEIGVQYGTDAERAIMHHVLDRRYLAVRPTVVVGNVDIEGLQDYLGERAVSRLHEAGGLVVTFDWGDYRMRKP